MGKYKNYIPLDFFEQNKTTVYSSEKNCLKKEGSFFEFDPIEVDLSICVFNNNKLVIDNQKDKDKKDRIKDYKENTEKKKLALEHISSTSESDIDSMDLVELKELIKKIVTSLA